MRTVIKGGLFKETPITFVNLNFQMSLRQNIYLFIFRYFSRRLKSLSELNALSSGAGMLRLEFNVSLRSLHGIISVCYIKIYIPRRYIS